MILTTKEAIHRILVRLMDLERKREVAQGVRNIEEVPMGELYADELEEEELLLKRNHESPRESRIH